MGQFEGCYCFAIPHKMFRRLIAEAPESAGAMRTHRHMEHSGKLRSLRYETAARSSAPPKTAGTLRLSVFNVDNKETLPGKLIRTNGDPPASDATANEAFENAGIALRFYSEVVGRNSVDGCGMAIDSAIHYGEGFPNAMWNGRQMIYGDGNETIGGFTGALDIIAHELTHGVSQHLIPTGLGVVAIPEKEREFKEQKYTLKGQAGALNESFSDIFASMIKQWHAGQTAQKANWLIGEGILAPMFGRAIRSLARPGDTELTWNHDEQIRTMDRYHEDCDAHDASGIPNHAFYLAATKLGGHSWGKAGPIWMNAYATLGANASFSDAANATVTVAATQFGAKSAEAAAVRAAWREVKVL